MADETTELHRAKRGVAILASCIVETLNDGDPTFKDRFLKRLTEAYYKVRDEMDGDVIQELELLSWTRQYLTGFDQLRGQGEPLFEQRESPSR